MGTGFRFEAVSAEDYEELRPGYAAEAVAWVADAAAIREGSLVVDLAAGTGQLACRFARYGARVVAVEPAENMRGVLAGRSPGLDVRDGRAEAIPLADDEADAVVVGNAFHHFDAPAALAQIRRVLRPGGTFAMFWARLDRDEAYPRYPGLEAIAAAVDAAVSAGGASAAIQQAYRTWSEAPPHADGFTSFERRGFGLTHTLSSARLADLYATSSNVASLDASIRSELLDRVRELSSQLPETLRLPAKTFVDRCRPEEA